MQTRRGKRCRQVDTQCVSEATADARRPESQSQRQSVRKMKCVPHRGPIVVSGEVKKKPQKVSVTEDAPG